MKALVIVDIQNDFTAGGALEVPDANSIIPLVNSLQRSFDLVVATQDWHPETHKSFASQHAGKRPFDKIDLNGLEQVLWPDHCIQGGDGSAFHKDLDLKKVEAIFRKGMDPEIDSYSGFYDNGHRKNTGLSGYLRERNVTQLYICGLAGDYCVFFTAMDALQEGFATYIIEDATRSISTEGFAASVKTFRDNGGMLINSGRLVV